METKIYTEILFRMSGNIYQSKAFKYMLFFLAAIAILTFLEKYYSPIGKYRQLWGHIENSQKLEFYLKTIGQMTTAFGGAMLLFNYLNAQQNTKMSERNLILAEKTFEANINLNQQRLIWERFSVAVAKLGDEAMAVRLSGILSLERLNKDAAEQYAPIVEVLSYFLKERCGVRALLLHQDSPDREKLVEIEILIQAALVAIARCCQDRGELAEMPDLSSINLESLNLRNVSIPGMNFTSAYLHKFQLYDGVLRGSSLRGAHLELADLRFSDLRHIDLSVANLYKADLSHSYLSSASFKNATMHEIKLHKSYLNRANLQNADIRYGNLRYADMADANLSKANLQGVDFSEANLKNANLSGANLQEADVSNAKGLEPSQIKAANNWEFAIFSHAFKRRL
ncbi:MAG: pentapeptide repeat-containing protein [Leptolyngbya sp. SIO1E4]|nr:pentapeptide repeat-containing protein [Leptolyngbya sp. SIO1E4]